MKISQSQINLAARLYTLAMAANAESLSFDANINRMRERARTRALKCLERLGTGAWELRTDEECLEVALRLKP